MENYDPITTTVVDCTFVGNASTGTDGSTGGGAIGLDGISAILDVSGSTLSGNTAFCCGGAIWVAGFQTSLRIATSTIQNNSQTSGWPNTGALWVQGAGPDPYVTLMNCRVLGNSDNGIHNIGSVRVIGCEVTDNAGTGLHHGGSSMEVVNCTISQNQRGMLFLNSGTLRNSVVWGNTDSEIASVSSPMISDSNVRGSGGSSNWNPAFGTDEGGNIDVDPFFASPASGDFSLGAGSPCIDAADNTEVPLDEFDLDGNGIFNEPLPYDLAGYARFIDDPSTVDTGVGPAPIVDMGSFESGVVPGTPFCFGDAGLGTPCPCSNDNDGTVPGSGCANGAFASGAQLTGSGVASVAADTLVLTTTGLHPNNTGLYFQANNRVNEGNGIAFGDGLRCAGGGVVRLQVRSSDASGTSSTTIALGAKGGVVAGETKRYQCWYRDTSGNQPCGVGVNEFNLSNGYEILWTP